MRVVRATTASLLAAALGAVAFGCSDVGGPEAWAGRYETAIKFDGPEGVWEAYGDLIIAEDSTVTLSGAALAGAVFLGDTLSWEVASGNGSSASVTFRDSDDRSFYWMAPVGESFTGRIQFPGGDPLDIRGRKV